MSFPTSLANGDIHQEHVYSTTIGAWKKLSINEMFPIGMMYIQYPGKSDPSTLGWPGTWTNVSSTYAGDFFRTEGGDASAFGGGEQLDQMQGHITDDPGNHNHTFDGNTVGGESNTSGPFCTTDYSPNYNRPTSSAGAHTHGLADDGVNGTPRTGSETRPVNQTIRIWERTA